MAYLNSPPFEESDFPVFTAIRQQFGFLPNFYPAQVARPDLVDAEIKLMESILFHESALSRQQKEYIFLVCSAANLSTYCVTAHCEIVRLLGIQGPEPEQIAVDFTVADIPVAMKALLAFAAKLTNSPTRFGSQDVETLRTYGYTDQQIMETVVMVGLAKFANYIAFGLGTLPDFNNARVIFEQTAEGSAGSRVRF